MTDDAATKRVAGPEPPEELQRKVYDDAGDRIIEALPPGLYLVFGRPASTVVRIDYEHRARAYPFVVGGHSWRSRPYTGRATRLLRVSCEETLYRYLSWPIPEGVEPTNAYEEARKITPWAYAILEFVGGRA